MLLWKQGDHEHFPNTEIVYQHQDSSAILMLMFKIIWCMYFTCSSVPFCSVQPGFPPPQIYGKTLPVPLNNPLNSLPKRFNTITLLKVSSMSFGIDSIEGANTFPHLFPGLFLKYTHLIVPHSPSSTPIPILLPSPFSAAECFIA